jgi:hypothetical protein
MDHPQRFFRGKDHPMRKALFFHLILDVYRRIGTSIRETRLEPETGLQKLLGARAFPPTRQHRFIDARDAAPFELSPALRKNLRATDVPGVGFTLHEQHLRVVARVLLDKEP